MAPLGLTVSSGSFSLGGCTNATCIIFCATAYWQQCSAPTSEARSLAASPGAVRSSLLGQVRSRASKVSAGHVAAVETRYRGHTEVTTGGRDT